MAGARLRDPGRLRATFLVVMVLLVAVLAGLAWKLLDQDRELATARATERRDGAATVLIAALERKLWDTSALVPLIVEERTTPAMTSLLEKDPDVVAWMLTGVELLSVFGRLGRSSSGLADLLPGIRHDAMELFSRWVTVSHVEGVRRRAERLVGVHRLAAADAMQLGAALLAADDRPETLDFVTLDKTLARAARLEGFRVLTGWSDFEKRVVRYRPTFAAVRPTDPARGGRASVRPSDCWPQTVLADC